MEIKTKRFLLFLIGCIGSRSLLVYITKNINPDKLPYFGYIASMIGLGFLYIYFFGSETADKQLEWAGDKMIWWNHLRIYHGLLYLIFAMLAFNKNKYSWVVLLIDVVLGLVSWLAHHKIFTFI